MLRRQLQSQLRGEVAKYTRRFVAAPKLKKSNAFLYLFGATATIVAGGGLYTTLLSELQNLDGASPADCAKTIVDRIDACPQPVCKGKEAKTQTMQDRTSNTQRTALVCPSETPDTTVETWFKEQDIPLDRVTKIVLTGNTGAGKSYMLNQFLGDYVFDSRVTEDGAGLTTTAERVATIYMKDGLPHGLVLYNLPGVYEGNRRTFQKRNIEALNAPFKQLPQCKCSILYAFHPARQMLNHDIDLVAAIKFGLGDNVPMTFVSSVYDFEAFPTEAHAKRDRLAAEALAQHLGGPTSRHFVVPKGPTSSWMDLTVAPEIGDNVHEVLIHAASIGQPMGLKKEGILLYDTRVEQYCEGCKRFAANVGHQQQQEDAHWERRRATDEALSREMSSISSSVTTLENKPSGVLRVFGYILAGGAVVAACMFPGAGPAAATAIKSTFATGVGMAATGEFCASVKWNNTDGVKSPSLPRKREVQRPPAQLPTSDVSDAATPRNAPTRTTSVEYRQTLLKIENATKDGFNSSSGRWTPHPSPEGGEDTLGYGHKLSAAEHKGRYVQFEGVQYPFKDGVPDAVVKNIFEGDVRKGEKTAAERYGAGFYELPQNLRDVLVDFTFNPNTHFVDFEAALKRRDLKSAIKESTRVYKDVQDGRIKPLTARNEYVKRKIEEEASTYFSQ